MIPSQLVCLLIERILLCTTTKMQTMTYDCENIILLPKSPGPSPGRVGAESCVSSLDLGVGLYVKLRLVSQGLSSFLGC